MGKDYGKRPSELIGISDQWLALEWDIAIWRIGNKYETEAIEENNKDNSGRLSIEDRIKKSHESSFSSNSQYKIPGSFRSTKELKSFLPGNRGL